MCQNRRHEPRLISTLYGHKSNLLNRNSFPFVWWDTLAKLDLLRREVDTDFNLLNTKHTIWRIAELSFKKCL